MATIYGVDNEFAVATGSNVGSGTNTSTFDNPPSGSKDLVINTNPGDPEPYIYDIGDTYDVSWGGSGGGGSIEDAVVIRSDAAPGGGGIVVFEGTDGNGDIVQVVWTPGFNLEGWYSDNYNPSMEPQFYTSDQDPGYTYSYVCFAAGTLISTLDGSVPVEAIRPGDLVRTRDDGPVPLVWSGRRTLRGTKDNAPVRFEAGTIGNARDLYLSQQHRILLTSPLAELYFGATEVLIPARAMIGAPGITIAPRPEIDYVHLLFERHQIVLAEGASCESLLMGDVALNRLVGEPDLLDADAARANAFRHTKAARPVLTMKEARLLTGTLSLPAPAVPELALV
ncbi:Hint domain-containing protein [Flavimaricola marinus]|uniref:Hedgehog/Intein (Hint) domain-containing protein n=1 Tax=Flavimaricola marinus TaxID=1819565 RepID=A0A238LHH1_9RHOB|nr:Hint domain-containing protein [Flavimaricola marinus]SMY09032.1 hypothetical protein LOM8899_03193 [Flavimaricola marinus]